MTETEKDELRDAFIEQVRRRLVGPTEPDETMRERPNKRYLTGMVFPQGASAGAGMADENPDGEDAEAGDEGDEEYGLESPTDILFQRLPASVGMTFAVSDAEQTLTVRLKAAVYEKHAAELLGVDASSESGTKRTSKAAPVWSRRPVPAGTEPETLTLRIDKAATDIREPRKVLDSRAELRVFIRVAGGRRVVTVALVNTRRTEEDTAVDTEDILFQVEMSCIPSLGVMAYPDPPMISPDPEAEELALQYRDMPAFAVGHGCGVFWPEPAGGMVSHVAVDYLPSVEVPPVTTKIAGLPSFVTEALSMKRLQDDGFDPVPAFRGLVKAYADWKDKLAAMRFEPRFDGAKARILERIEQAVDRMSDGIDLLEENPDVRHMFRLANRAMLISLARSGNVNRRKPGSRFTDVDPAALAYDGVTWRPFQIAFFLISLRGLWNPDHPSREIVDLIWFPTGGGKTEAYLGVAAFEMIRRRLVDGKQGGGTAVIKRYTLRLLTIQQFERAGSLVCAMETMRRQGDIEHAEPFSLGLWVGSDSAPNRGADAQADLQKIVGTTGRVDGIRVPLKQCPVCGKRIIPESKAEGAADVGIRKKGTSVELFCSDAACPFHGGLPISFVDEDLYARPPTLLLGTVDKFAMLAWREEARAFFGAGAGVAPPSLIIQDELHLISGPLGTLAGIYEAAIDRIISHLGRPAKYICATATIRRSDDQIRKLYGREGALFPPAGLSASNSFFSRVPEERKDPGRLYVGAMGQGHTPTFSNVIASSALLAAGEDMRKTAGDRVDTWWTVVAYHNSKRELGKTLSLARDDIPGRLKALGEARRVAASRVSELSANLRDSEIPEALHRLRVELPNAEALDYVACTNMLSVGVDVQRLGLMLVNGQPKTVSEYIQASSRVGRSTDRPPGIVFTLFSPTKPRDRSHYEFFRHFHKAFYRNVEPTSVTPFALPAQERGLHGAFLALVRMVSPIAGNRTAGTILRHESTVRELAAEFLDRIGAARDGNADETRERLEDFIATWIALAREKGSALRFQAEGKQYTGLIRPFRQPGTGIETLQSLRNVDAPMKLLVPVVQTGTAAKA
ncbi:helicase-related protein [Herbaspirillum sp. SJZ107]|uniref:helicase-related protein n=1 Tax=Herbaspirillum sp. SJZ107 TaxID=2572881 RepID=UPI00114E0F72|nr:helicase-related protein [Herbaspirillum sp. SJZ107]TQK03433.1 helicase-like protein [Herbaspirillum sp. SJZ107]